MESEVLLQPLSAPFSAQIEAVNVEQVQAELNQWTNKGLVFRWFQHPNPMLRLLNSTTMRKRLLEIGFHNQYKQQFDREHIVGFWLSLALNGVMPTKKPTLLHRTLKKRSKPLVWFFQLV